MFESQLDYLDAEDRLVSILQEIKDYDPEICKLILEKIHPYKGNLQLTKIARPFREAVISFIGEHSPTRIKNIFDTQISTLSIIPTHHQIAHDKQASVSGRIEQT